MTKTENDEAYEDGFKAGKEGNFLSDAGKIAALPITHRAEIWNKGYDEGARHRGEESSEEETSSNDSSSSSDSSCYLTTTCVNVMGLPNNCLELQVLRKFRNKILMPTSKGRKAIQEYHKLAPEIVQSIDGRGNAEFIWKQIYTDIRHAVSLVLNNDFEGAFKHYKQVTLNLKEKYLS